MADIRTEASEVNSPNLRCLDFQSLDGTDSIGNHSNLQNSNYRDGKSQKLLSSLGLENDRVSQNGVEFDVGGVICDEEDKGCLNFNNTDTDHSAKFLPQLVFLDSEENISNVVKEEFTIDKVTPTGFSRSVSDTAVPNGHTVRDRSSPSLLNDSFNNPVSSRLSGVSHSSLQSNDSDLLVDHTIMVLESESTNHTRDNDSEQLLVPHSEEDPEWQDWHCHSANQTFPSDKMARNQLIAVSALCFLFMIGEAIGGALSNSLALFTDVLHLGSDLISFLISLLSMYLAKKSATRNMTFGYHRAEVLGALFSVFIIWSVTGVLVYVAIERIVHEHYKDVKPDEMLITAVLGVVFNIVMGVVLHSEICCGGSKGIPSFGHTHGGSHGHSHGNSHGHSHGHSHNSRSHNNQRSSGRQHTGGFGGGDSYQPLLNQDDDDDNLQMNDTEVTIQGEITHVDKPHPKNINVRAAFIHVIGDIIQSLGVLLASIIIKLKPEEKYRLADPICTFLFSLLVLLTTINVLRDTLRIILEGVPRDTDYYSIKSSFQKIPGVKAVHGLTVWCLTLEKNALAVHLAVDESTDHKQVLYEASRMLKRDYSFLHSTIQVEDYKPAIMAKCVSCQELRK